MQRVAGLREAVAKNWKGPGQALPDLGSNIEYLRACYEASRRDYLKTPKCPR